MTRIALVTMPFASSATPSLGLTQLKHVLDRRFGDEVETTVCYVNHDAAAFIDDVPFYKYAVSNHGFRTGLGDWFFRAAAFPDAPDNAEEYLGLYHPGDGDVEGSIRHAVAEKRPQLDRFLSDVIEKHDLTASAIVGLSSTFSQTTASLALARKLKERKPGIIVVMGGAACTREPGLELLRNCDCLDYVFSGPALVSFPEFVRHCLAGDRSACDRIDGVFSRNNQSQWQLSGRDGAASPLSSLGAELDVNENLKLDYTPYLDALEAAFPDGEWEHRLLFETSRGCWWGEKVRCSFCGLNGPDICFRAMTPENALEQIRWMLSYAPRCDFFASVDNILSRDYLTGVFPHLRTPPGVRLQYELRADLTEEEIGVLCNAGVTAIQPGLEALSTATLKLMKKGTSAFSNVRFLKRCSKFPVFVGWNIVMGLPREDTRTYEKYLADMPKLTHLPPPMMAHPVEYVRHTDYFDNPEKYGLDLHPEPYYALTYPFGAQALADLAHRFMDANCDVPDLISWMNALCEGIRFWNTRWYNRDGGEQAQLRLIERDDEPVVYDSRTGQVVEHHLSRTAEALLHCLEEPRRVEELTVELPDRSDAEVAEAFAFLRAQDLLFEEGGRFMSLVIV